MMPVRECPTPLYPQPTAAELELCRKCNTERSCTMAYSMYRRCSIRQRHVDAQPVQMIIPDIVGAAAHAALVLPEGDDSADGENTHG